ncbi:antiterminator Q family protein, partial [Pseudomonas aeruginosa]
RGAPAAPTSEATEMNIKALEFLMEQYGLWVWSDNGTPRGSSPMLALMKRNPANEKRFAAVIPCISDDRALQVDRFLARLYDEDPDAIRSLILYFIHGMSYRDIQDRMGISYADARMLVRAGLSALLACFVMEDKKAA